MTKPTPSTPTPTAVPWTPDMMTQAPQPTLQSVPAPAPNYQQQPHMLAPQAMPQAVYGQTAPHSAEPYSAQPAFEPPHNQHPAYAPIASAQPYGQSHVQHATAYGTPQQPPLEHLPAHQNNPQAMPPPVLRRGQGQQQMRPATERENEAETKSLLSRLMKRTPKVVALEAVPAADMPQASGKLVNKNFALGALTGLIFGAVVLPMVLGMFGGESSATPQALAQTDVQPVVVLESSEGAREGGSFVDRALSTETP